MKAIATVLGALSLAAVSPAAAETFQPQGLHVVGGEGWQAQPGFELRWSNPEGVAAVHYRVLTESGQTAVTETTLEWPAATIEYLNVPATPGVYTAEVWLEDPSGQLGPPASAKLRFDDVVPGRARPAPLPAWIGRNAFPLTVRLARPEGAEPPSGIRGYAFAIDHDPEGDACAGTRLCEEAETDLRGGPGDNTAVIPGLPEGTAYLHAVAVSGSGVRSVTETIVLRVDQADPAVTLSGAPAGWSNRPVRLVAEATDSASGMAASGASPVPFTAIQVDGGAPVSVPGDMAATTVIASGVHTVDCYAGDAAGNVADGAAVDGRRNAAPETALVRLDRDRPAVAFAVAQDPGDPERIEAHVADSLSGFDRSRGSIAVRPAGSRQPFVGLPTSARGDFLQARWDSAAYPPRLYEFRATGYDVAGNETSTLLRANRSRMLLRAPLKVPVTLRVDADRRVVGFGQAVRFSGRLIAGRHTPLKGMAVRVIERFGNGSPFRERVSVLRTGRDGRFAAQLAPGPSREVTFSTMPTPTLAGASSGPIRVAVSGRLGLRASAPTATVGGRPVVFSGTVRGGPLPEEGKTVQLQFRLPGRGWSEFRTVRADARGRFRYAYRFVDDDSRGARFQFRAFAPPQAGWPYEAAGSRPVTVDGR